MMNVHYKTFMEEIRFYEVQNQWMAVEDLLNELFDEAPLNKHKILENERRIENLCWNVVEIM